MVFSAIKNAYTAFRNFFDTHHRTMLKRGAIPVSSPVEYTENGARKRKEDGVTTVLTSET